MGTEDRLLEQLNKLRGSQTLIVGIGNLLKADDAAGPMVCQKLQSAKVSAEIIDAGTVPENYIQTIIKKAPQNLLVVDAIDFSDSAGKINILRPEQLNSLIISTHTLSPRLFVDMVAQAIDVNMYFIGIQPAQTKLAAAMSQHVTRAVERLVRILTAIFPPGTKKL